MADLKLDSAFWDCERTGALRDGNVKVRVYVNKLVTLHVRKTSTAKRSVNLPLYSHDAGTMSKVW